MHWSYDDLLALPQDIHEELVAWVREAREAREFA
jgi:hypothetical protein